jgi:outer membrane protein
MKKPIHTLISLGAFGAAAVIAQAQPAPKILVVDMAKIFDTHYETQAEKAKLDDATKKAQDQIDQLNKEGDALVAQYKELDEQSKNPAATADAKAKAVADAQKKGQEIQAKLADRNNLANNAKSVRHDAREDLEGRRDRGQAPRCDPGDRQVRADAPRRFPGRLF